jgi:hypothetical protein
LRKKAAYTFRGGRMALPQRATGMGRFRLTASPWTGSQDELFAPFEVLKLQNESVVLKTMSLVAD